MTTSPSTYKDGDIVQCQRCGKSLRIKTVEAGKIVFITPEARKNIALGCQECGFVSCEDCSTDPGNPMLPVCSSCGKIAGPFFFPPPGAPASKPIEPLAPPQEIPPIADDGQKKKCPMCAEEIPLAATVCEYCGTRFEVTQKDGRIESRFFEESASKPTQSTPAPVPIVTPIAAPAPKQRKSAGVWIASVLGLFLIIGLIGGGIWLAQKETLVPPAPTRIANEEVLPPSTPIPTKTTRPTATPNRTATQEARNEQSTTAAKDAWVQGFAEPILDDIASHAPNFEDDFSTLEGRFYRWWIPDKRNVTFTEGIIRLNTTDTDWTYIAGGDGEMSATDFVLKFDFTPRIASEDSQVIINFRTTDKGQYSFNLSLSDDWWEMGNQPVDQDWQEIVSGFSDEISLNRTTSLIIIAKGDAFAVYTNEQSLAYSDDPTYQGDYIQIGVWSPNGIAEVDFDNVKFWDLNNLVP